MSKIIPIINQKGGVGKTATACNLAHCFAKHGSKTLLIDLDPSANASHIFMQCEPKFTTRDLLSQRNTYATTQLAQKAFQGEDIVDNLFLIPADIKLALLDRELSHRSFRESILFKRLNELQVQAEFDVILIDCAPTLSTLTINAIFAADFILIPVNYSRDALEGMLDLMEVVTEIKHGHSFDTRVVRNMHDSRKTVTNAHMAELFHQEIGDSILKTIIEQNEGINRAALESLTVFGAGSYAAKSNYEDLYYEVKNLWLE